ncbi:MAG: single-stranded-DNA-specific exonuclease RecJ [Magnetococcales bacterium]|nr:single-stranded-DNA-specific exonuclease RecJ [Magnetococcales bacterium]MBF0149024.1 single-stranded-DNA-specific exonuclease RecJ [Magnetococcales bacterium]
MMAPLSFSKKIWKTRKEPLDCHRQLAREAGLEPFYAGIFADRHLTAVEDVRRFFEPKLGMLADPLGLRDMELGVARIILALERKEKMAVFGDYDVDGATSSALLIRYFRILGVELHLYVPDRLTEGYGPNDAAMRTLAGEGVTLVITVDCGITAHEAVETARGLGMEVIITDHHQPRDTLPSALAVINPNRADESFSHKELAGVGVAFYLVMALNRALRERGYFTGIRAEPDLKTLLDLVAVGTIADVAPLMGLNRIMVKVGLLATEHTRHVGLRVLQEAARLSGRLSAGQVGFQIGPRINAGGRLSRGRLGAELLATDDPVRAGEIAQFLEQANRERQLIEEKIQKQAFAQMMQLPPDKKILGHVLADRNWHPGVVGIVASRIAEKTHRPTIVIALDEQGIGKGSARSIPGVNLLQAIDACQSHLLAFGGHHAAAGLTIEQGQLLPFAEAFNRFLAENTPEEVFQMALLVDGHTRLTDFPFETVAQLERLQPFGRGNPEPVFVFENIRVTGQRILKDRHVKCHLADLEDNTLEAIAFNVFPGPLGEGILSGRQRLDVAGSLTINRFQGRERVQLIIRDARLAQQGSQGISSMEH